MQKTLNTWNVVLYGIQYSISLLYVGYEWGDFSHASLKIDYLILPVVYLLFLVNGLFMVCRWEYITSKRYYTMAAVTLAYISALWGLRLFLYFHDSIAISLTSKMDLLVYPAVLFGISVLISIIYVLCGIKTQREE